MKTHPVRVDLGQTPRRSEPKPSRGNRPTLVRGDSVSRMQTPDFPDDDWLQVLWAPDGAAVLTFTDGNGEMVEAHLYEDGSIKTKILQPSQ